jgi:pimeloyl-ACP methyl ester carboxylesterase
MTGRLVPTNGIEVWTELDGDGAAPPLVLLGGSDASVLRWPPEFVSALVDGGRFVVRVEHRDSGLSSKVDPDTPYRLEDLAVDTAGVLEALAIERADFVGYSMGGAVAQILALEHPSCVRSLALVATTPGAGDERMPPPEGWFVERMAERLFAPLPRTTPERIEWTVDLYRLLAGDRYPFDEAAQRALAAAEIDRCWYPESGHGVAVNASPSRYDRLGEISVPTLVLHGERDPVYPVDHAVALAARIPGADLIMFRDLGHEIPPAFAAELASLVLGFTEPLRPH